MMKYNPFDTPPHPMSLPISARLAQPQLGCPVGCGGMSIPNSVILGARSFQIQIAMQSLTTYCTPLKKTCFNLVISNTLNLHATIGVQAELFLTFSGHSFLCHCRAPQTSVAQQTKTKKIRPFHPLFETLVGSRFKYKILNLGLVQKFIGLTNWCSSDDSVTWMRENNTFNQHSMIIVATLNDNIILNFLEKYGNIWKNNSSKHSLWPYQSLAAAMRSKTTSQLRAGASRWQRWQLHFPWLLVGKHGLACTTCQKAGLDSVWSRGEGDLAGHQ